MTRKRNLSSTNPQPRRDPVQQQGTLFVVATPIGNLKDISARAISVLCAADLVLAEDTRKFRILAAEFDIQTPCLSYHDHNEIERAKSALEILLAGQSVALISEAGTPTISDPGYRLLQMCHEHRIPVCAIPGPCAAIAALSISGFPLHRFVFAGFLPQKPGKKRAAVADAIASGTTTVFYESPHRIVRTLELITEAAPQCEVLIAREMTKIHEEILRGPALMVTEALRARSAIKGEIVLVLSGGH